jgi:acyl-CoA synthetase (AMP-forming)/AMP-acid ligase II
LIWKLLKTENITHYNAAPTVNTLLCASKEAAKLPSPVRVTVAASPPTAHLFEQMTNLNLIPVHVYGLTETYGPVTKSYHMPVWETLPVKEKYARMARQGHGFITSLAVRVVKTEGVKEGELVDVKKDGKEVGEIIFFGNSCAKEYLNDPEATRKLFLGGGLHSGDLAVWHEDGSVHILDRQKDIIISGMYYLPLRTQEEKLKQAGGENISSVALEAMLVQHPDVLEAAVVAVADSHWGERPKAFITVIEGRQMNGEDLIQWAKNESSISKFMVPREVEIVSELPKTSTGKVQKKILRDWAKGIYDEK